MISTLLSSLNKKLQAVELTKPTRRKASVYRDELNKPKQPTPQINKVKKRVRFAETEPVIISINEDPIEERKLDCGDEMGESEKVVRIKVKMTKEEACRMLSRCSNGGVLEFGDLASELMRIPAARVSSAMAAN